MKAVEFTGKVENGKLPNAVSERIAATIRMAEGKHVTVAVSERKRRRSLSANAYMWGVVYPALVEMFREYGNDVDADDVHLYCKLHVGKLRETITTPDGEVVQTVGSTAKLTPKQFAEYLDKVMAFAAEHGCVIPLPGEFNQPQGDQL